MHGSAGASPSRQRICGDRWTATGRDAKAAGKDLLDEARAAGDDSSAGSARPRGCTAGWADRPLAEALVDAALSQAMVRLARTGCWGEANRLPSGDSGASAGPVLEVGSLQHHARFKPHGYAGDYVMLTRICEESCCEHPLGSLFDGYFLRQAAPEAVAPARSTRRRPWSRTVSSGRKGISGGERRLGAGDRRGPRGRNLARGSRGPRSASRSWTWTRRPSMRRAGGWSRWWAGRAVTCIRTNLYRLAQGARGAESSAVPTSWRAPVSSITWTTGRPRRFWRLFWRQLAAGGRLLVGNFAPHNPSRAYMEWIGNWYLKYRTAEEMESLALAAGIPRAISTSPANGPGSICSSSPRSDEASDEDERVRGAITKSIRRRIKSTSRNRMAGVLFSFSCSCSSSYSSSYSSS